MSPGVLSRHTVVLPQVAASINLAGHLVHDLGPVTGFEVVVDARPLSTATEDFTEWLVKLLAEAGVSKVLVHGSHPEFVGWASQYAAKANLAVTFHEPGLLPAETFEVQAANQITFGGLMQLTINDDGSVTIDLPHGVLVERAPHRLVVRRDVDDVKDAPVTKKIEAEDPEPWVHTNGNRFTNEQARTITERLTRRPRSAAERGL